MSALRDFWGNVVGAAEEATDAVAETASSAYGAVEEAAFKATIRDQYDTQGNPDYASARLWDDGVIDPADTRMFLGLGVNIALKLPLEETRFGVFRM